MSDNFDPYKEWLGIEPHERPANHYRLLGLELFNAKPDDVRRAAEARMQLLRSFQSGPRGKATQQLLNEVSAAKLCLLDNNTRITYDAALQGALAVQEVVPQQPPPPRRGRSGGTPDQTSSPDSNVSPPPPPSRAGNPPQPTPVAYDSRVAQATAATVATPPPPPARAITSRGKKKSLTQESWFIPSVVCGVVAFALLSVLGYVLFGPKGKPIADKDNLHSKPPHQEVVTNEPPENDVPPIDVPPAENLSPLVQEKSDGSLTFFPREARLTGPLEIKPVTKAEVITGWQDAGETAQWRFKIKTPSIYRVKVEYAATPDDTDARFRATVGEAKKSQSARSKGPATFVTDAMFLPVTSQGEHTLVFEVEDVAGGTFSLKSIELVPSRR